MMEETIADGDAQQASSEDDSSFLAMDAVYDALRSGLRQFRGDTHAVAELAAALELCAMTGDVKAGELLSEIRRGS